MPLPVFGPALVGAATSLLGGRESRKENRRTQERAEAFQREFAQHGIRWRVEDAKAAGLHPLYALGAQIPAAQPVAFGDTVGPAMAEAGQNFSRAMMAAGTPMEREAHVQSMRLLESQTAESDARAAYYGAEAFKTMRDTASSNAIPMGPSGVVVPEGQAPRTNVGAVSVVPPEIGTFSGEPGVQAGRGEMWQRWRLSEGFEVVLPATLSGSPSEALESLSESALLMHVVAQENRRRYGPEAWDKFADRYFFGLESGKDRSGAYLQDLIGRMLRSMATAVRPLGR